MLQNYEAFEYTKANYVPLSPLSFLKRAETLYGDKTAVIYGDLRVTWSEIGSRIRKLATGLNRVGINRGDTISVLCTNIPELFELHFAIPLSGAVINTLNTRLEVETIAYILEHSDSQLVIVEKSLIPLLSQALEKSGLRIPVIEICGSDESVANSPERENYEQLLTGSDESQFELNDEWEAIALSYTSGTSGRPKGVVYHHRGSYLMALGTVAAWEIPKHLVYLSVVPMFHCNGWGHPWIIALQGGTMVFTRSPSPDLITEAIREHGVTHFGAAPIVLHMLAESGGTSFDSRIRVLTAGAPPPPSILEETKKMGLDVMQVYGLTETYGHISQCVWQDHWARLSDAEQARLQAQQGVAFPMVEDVTVINSSTGSAVPRDGVTQGEISIRGNTVMKGYYKDETATENAFKDGRFWSGDAAVVHPDGYIQIRDRLKDVIISGGENISSVEVEAVLYRHPAVLAAAVVAKKDAKWGEVPCAFVELREDQNPDEQEVIEFCRQHLAGFKIPKSVVFGELPKTATGKLQKFLLRKRIDSEVIS